MSKPYTKDYFENKFSQPDPWEYANSEYEKEKYLKQIDLIQKYLQAPSTILELGCSEGIFTSMLEKAFTSAAITAVDISEAALERAAKNTSRTSLISGNVLTALKDLPLRFDVIICSEIIYYLGATIPLTELTDFVKALRDHLHPGGILILANNMIEKDFPETYMVEKPLVETYISLIARYLQLLESNEMQAKKHDEQLLYLLTAFQVKTT